MDLEAYALELPHANSPQVPHTELRYIACTRGVLRDADGQAEELLAADLINPNPDLTRAPHLQLNERQVQQLSLQ